MSDSSIKIDMLETKVKELNNEMKETQIYMSELMCKMLLIEEEQNFYKSASHDGVPT